MTSDFAFIALWLLALQLFGWMALPLSRRFFAQLPDAGLAAGRVSALVFISLFLFWGAALKCLPLRYAPLFLIGLPLFSTLWSLRSPLLRSDFSGFLRARSKALLLSEAIFVAAFLFFVWVRMCRPELNDLEKPMDAAFIGQLARTQYLPPENPWFSGSALTNYYYFGHFMAALLQRLFGTPNWIAYNLIQPAFCAFFISTLWSLCAALTGSLRRGFIAMSMVALLGHFEPLRQIAAAGRLVEIDWWKTSRAIPDTINEYPAFTMLIGDAHAHFFAFTLASIFFCLCYQLLQPNITTRRQLGLSVCMGLVLAASAMTNTWDAPTYALLGIFVMALALLYDTQRQHWKWLLVVAPLLLSRLVVWPYSKDFRSPAGGVAIEFWSPPWISFLVLWGAFCALWSIFLTKSLSPKTRRTAILIIAVLPLALGLIAPVVASFAVVAAILGTTIWSLVATRNTTLEPEESSGRLLLHVVAATGCIALLAQMLIYMRTAWGEGPSRHLDTVFKFGLQTWLLLGTAAACGIITWWNECKWRFKIALPLLLVPIPLLCSFSVLRTRAVRDAPRDAAGQVRLSLDGARHLPPHDRAALAWLNAHAKTSDAVLEAVQENSVGQPHGDYTEFSRVSALSGIPTPLGWSSVSHVASWGPKTQDMMRRMQDVKTVFTWQDDARAKQALKNLGVRYIFVGDLERRTYSADALNKLRYALIIEYSSGESFVARVP